MKKLFLLAGFYCLYLSSYAQSSTSRTTRFTNGTMASVDSHLNAEETEAAFASVHARAVRDFKETYPEVRDETWTLLPDKEILCSFQHSGAAIRIFYSKHGRRRVSITGYEPGMLSKEVKDRISNYYCGYHIQYVNEINMAGFPKTYIINIENKDRLKVIRVSGDQMEEQREMVKG